MVKEQRLSVAPVLVVNLRSVFRCDRTHDTLLLCSFRNLNFRIQNEGMVATLICLWRHALCEAVFAGTVERFSQSSKRVAPSWALSPGTMLRSLNPVPK